MTVKPYMGETVVRTTGAAQLVIPEGVEYLDAVSRLFRLGALSSRYTWAFEDTGRVLPSELRYPQNTDWVHAAHELARTIGKRIELCQDVKGKVYRLVEDELDAPDSRVLAHELAFAMGRLDVDAMLAELTKEQWAEWKSFLRSRRPERAASERVSSPNVNPSINVTVDGTQMRLIAQNVVERSINDLVDSMGEQRG